MTISAAFLRAALLGASACATVAPIAAASGEPMPFRYEPEAAYAQDEPAPAPASNGGGASLSPSSFEVAGGVASDLSDVTIGILQVSWRMPVAEKLSVALFAEGLYAGQDSGDATGFGAGVSLRWNFSRVETTDIYLDAGCGMVVFSGDVPEGGSTFNFTPRAMIGLATAIGDDARFFVQAGWLHISNAQTSGTNPGIDSIALFAGFGVDF
jgi:hypothetical protein